jgi:hypothetical protein
MRSAKNSTEKYRLFSSSLLWRHLARLLVERKVGGRAAMNAELDETLGKGQTTRDLSTRVSETAGAAKIKAEQVAAATAARAREMTTTVGHKVRELAGRIRERAPHEGVRNTTDKVAEKLERAGCYLEETSFEGMADDLAGVIRRYPLQSVLIGIGIGFLLSRRRDHY